MTHYNNHQWRDMRAGLEDLADLIACLVIDLQSVISAMAQALPHGQHRTDLDAIRIALGDVMLRAEQIESRARLWIEAAAPDEPPFGSA